LIQGKIIAEMPGLFGWHTSRYLLFDPSIEWHTVLGTLTDGAGHKCYTILKQHCVGCNCDNSPGGVLSIDEANTPDTIVKNSSITVYVTGGCGPFTFATASLGYTFDGGVTSFVTEDRNATLSCADGACGVNFAATCSLTVTDDCNTVVSALIRNTSGGWILVTNGRSSDNICGTGGSISCSGWPVRTYYDGYKRWDVHGSGSKWGNCVTCNPSPLYWDYPNPPPFDPDWYYTTYIKTDGICCSETQTTKLVRYEYYKWSCP
jgi:hypothetical protein